jgi:hypothetical protein
LCGADEKGGLKKELFMTEKSAVFEKNYAYYLNQIAGLDLQSKAEKLGVNVGQASCLPRKQDACDTASDLQSQAEKLEGRVESDALIIPLFQTPYIVSGKGIADPFGNRPGYSVCILLFKYVLMCPDHVPEQSDWFSYRNFKDAGPLIGYFSKETETAVSDHFSGRIEDLKHAGDMLGGGPANIQAPFQFIRQFNAFPKVPMLMLFDDADEEFPARCSVLFENRVEKYLDMESVAILGHLFARLLIAARKGGGISC